MSRRSNRGLLAAALVLACSLSLARGALAQSAAKMPAINFMSWGNTYANPSARVLRDAYGTTQNANRSVIGRLPGMLSEQGGNQDLQGVLKDLERVDPKDLTINVLRESRADRIYDGETLYYPGPVQADGTQDYLRTQVRPGDSLETISRRLGVSTQDLVNANGDRIGVGAQYSGDGQIYINGQDYARAGNSVLADVIGHEAGHAVDGAFTDPDAAPQYYGRDNQHFNGEVLAERDASGNTTYYPETAWREGWANYNGMLANPASVKEFEAGNSAIWNEDPSKNDSYGDPARQYLDNPTYEDYRSTEDTSALALYMLNDGGARREQILDTFIAGNQNNPGNREMNSFFKDYVSANPADASRAGGALDLASQYTATPEKLTEILGSGGEHYLAQRDALAQEWATRLEANPGASMTEFYREQAAAGRFDMPEAPVQAEAAQPTETPQEFASATGAPSSAADAGVGEAPLAMDEVATDVGAGVAELEPATFEPDAPAPSTEAAAGDEGGAIGPSSGDNDLFADASLASDAGSDQSYAAGDDGGADVADDASYDAGTDAGADASYDAGSDAGSDAGADASYDAGSDAAAAE